MNQLLRSRITIAGAVVACVIVLFPPLVYSLGPLKGEASPKRSCVVIEWTSSVVDAPRLAYELFAVVVVTGTTLLIRSRFRKPQK